MGMIYGQGVAQADFRVTPSLSASERYQDNVRFSSTGKEADFSTVVTTALGFVGRTQGIDVSGSLGTSYSAYLKNSDLSTVSSQGGVSLKDNALRGALSGLELTLNEGYVYTQEFPVFAQFGKANEQPASGGIQTSRFTTFSNILGILMSYPVSPRSHVLGGYSNSYTRFSSGSSLVNSTIHTLHGGWSHTMTPSTTFNTSLQYSRFSFGGGNSEDTYGGNVGFSHQFLADMTMSANAGASYLPSQGRILPTYSLSLTKKFAATNVGLSATRSIATSGGLAAAVSTNDVLSVFVTHEVTRALTGTLSGNYGITKTVGLQTVDITSYGFTGGLFYAVNKWLNATGGFSYFKQQSQGLLGSSLDAKSVQVGVTATWP
jgi:hypothetical protein